MPQRRKQDSTDPSLSIRWPRFFRNVEQAEELLQHPGMVALLLDLQGKAELEASEVIDHPPKTEGELAEQNVSRGRILERKDLLGLADELKLWKEERRK